MRNRASLEFQCSSASRKFLNMSADRATTRRSQCFSALQRAENSSMSVCTHSIAQVTSCFSALQRAENSSISPASSAGRVYTCFSALQRAENSSMRSTRAAKRWTRPRFSALQRAENSSILTVYRVHTQLSRLSVLFSEPKIPQLRNIRRIETRIVVFQCSSASRKFLNFFRVRCRAIRATALSVLFSEPKIPQFERRTARRAQHAPFSALQRAENSSIDL